MEILKHADLVEGGQSLGLPPGGSTTHTTVISGPALVAAKAYDFCIIVFGFGGIGMTFVDMVARLAPPNFEPAFFDSFEPLQVPTAERLGSILQERLQ